MELNLNNIFEFKILVDIRKYLNIKLDNYNKISLF